MKLAQALTFSSLSDIKVDGCTLSPELGVRKYCKMHDHLLIHLVSKSHGNNGNQIRFITDKSLSFTMTRLQADRLFRDGLHEKVESKSGLSKAGYFLVKWIYYSAVRARSIIIK